MILTLEVTGPRGGRPGSTRKEFHATGGTIGRLPDSSLLLDDPYVSSRHALIHYVNGTYYIEDKSRNGVAINAPDQRLEHGQRYALKAGDRILIDPFEIRVSLADESVLGGLFTQNDPFALPESSRPPNPDVSPSPDPFSPVDLGSERDVDPLKGLGFEPGRGQGKRSAKVADPRQGSRLDESYKRPLPIPDRETPGISSKQIPTGYNPLVNQTSPPVSGGSSADPITPPSHPTPVANQKAVHLPSQRAAMPATGADNAGLLALADVLEGAGLDPAAVTPELARNFGQILHVVVSGVMDVLQARQRTKDEFGMGMTTFKPADNNPLKFSVDVDDALHNLLVKRNPKYLGPVDAFEDAFEDVKNHQIAMLAGLRVAFDAMLAKFDPDQLQEQFDRQKKGALVNMPAKLRYWDLYRAWIHDMVRDADDSFRELFGDEFAQAYEAQLKRLKAQGRSQKR